MAGGKHAHPTNPPVLTLRRMPRLDVHTIAITGSAQRFFDHLFYFITRQRGGAGGAYIYIYIYIYVYKENSNRIRRRRIKNLDL